MSARQRQEAGPTPVRDDSFRQKRVELAFNAVMTEYEFTSSLIPMYRGYQMNAVGFGMTLYAAAIGLVGALGTSPRFDGVVSMIGACITWPIAILVLAFWVMEIRIKRVSRYIDQTLSETLDNILDLETELGRPAVLKWERAPGRHLTEAEKWMSGSQAFILLLSFPAIASSVWYLVSGRHDPFVPMDAVPFAGTALLSVFVIYTSRYSARVEARAAGATSAAPGGTSQTVSASGETRSPIDPREGGS